MMTTHDPRRRVILRGAIATGCTLGIPVILLGCKGEQAEQVPAPSAPAASPSDPPAGSSADSPADSSNGADAGKLGQAEAKYQDTPNGEEQCGNCQHFVAESNTCRVVEGQVSPNGWCTLWTKQA